MRNKKERWKNILQFLKYYFDLKFLVVKLMCPKTITEYVYNIDWNTRGVALIKLHECTENRRKHLGSESYR